jgi:two-component system, NtrC family, sensor kinase
MPQLGHTASTRVASPSLSRAIVPPRPGRRTFRVLVIDDNVAIHADFRKVFASEQSDAGLDTLTEAVLGQQEPVAASHFDLVIESAYQGADGVARVRQAVAAGQPFALAFVDMRMPPGQDGLQTVLEAWSVDPHLQVVICTAFSDYSWQEISTATGETDSLVLLRKPFDPAEVLQLTHALCRKWEVQRELQRQVDNLEALVAQRTRESIERQALFQLILDNATDLIAVVDGEGRRLYNSPSYQTVLGLSPEELRTNHAFAQIHPDDRAAASAAIETARRTGRGDMLVYRMQHRDGSWRTLESCAGVIRGLDGQVAFLVIVARDITQRRELELKQQLGQKLESIGRLAAGIAHEINTPTQYVADNTRFLRDAFQTLAHLAQENRMRDDHPGSPSLPAVAPPVAADLDYVVKEIPRAIQESLQGLSHITRIVGSLKEFSHPNSPEKAPVDLNRAIETAISVSRHEWKYVAEMTAELDATVPLVPCILDEFNQVMLNLIVNAAHTIAEAIKARGEKRGRITIRSRLDGDAVRVEVADTGMGIEPELRTRIFEPFFTTKPIGQGTGQGLAIVHAIVVQHHQGAVDYCTQVGEGTTFRLWLPLASPNPGGS